MTVDMIPQNMIHPSLISSLHLQTYMHVLCRFMAGELLQKGPAEQSPDKQKEKEVNDLLQQVRGRDRRMYTLMRTWVNGVRHDDREDAHSLMPPFF